MMGGYFYAILTGIFFGLQGTYSKVLTNRIPPMILTWGIFAFTLPYLILLLMIQGVPSIVWRDFWWATSSSFAINLFAWNFYFRALHAAPLSQTMPFTAFTPLFLIPVAYILLGEMPDRIGFMGIFLIILGGYGIHLNSKSLVAPVKSLFHNKGTRYMLIVALLWSVSATVEKVAVISSSQVFYGFTINLLLSLAYLPYLFINRKAKTGIIAKNLKGLFILGLISGLMILFQFTALKFLFVSYVIAFKRAGIIVSVFLGAVLFKEKNPARNLLFSGLMVAGVLILLL